MHLRPILKPALLCASLLVCAAAGSARADVSPCRCTTSAERPRRSALLGAGLVFLAASVAVARARRRR